MKTLLTFFIASFLPVFISAQITITLTDMPNVGDSLFVTSTFVPMGLDYTESGADFTWDFSGLTGGAQDEEIFVAVSSTPLLYQAVFNWPPWNPPATIASPDDDFSLIPGVAFTDYYDFFKEQNASYTSVGFGVTINNIPVPVKYNNPEMLYKFPLSYGNSSDSSESFYSISIPDLGYYETYRKRVNTVDGWGTLITPFGTFATLRIKSFLTIRDSIYVDSLQTGIPVKRDITEYKWMGNGFGVPLLKVSKEGLLPAQAAYLSGQQEPLNVDAGPDVTILQGELVQLQATATGGSPPFEFVWSNGAVGTTINVSPEISTTYTVNVVDAGFNFASDDIVVNVVPAVVNQLDLPKGWSSISSWIMPLDTSIASLVQPIGEELVIMQNLEGIYFPDGGVNTLENWDQTSGYMIKTTEPVVLSITGHPVSTEIIELQSGWNLLPVLSDCEVETSDIYNQIEQALVMIKDVAGMKIFWPEQSVAALTWLQPGNAYLILVNEDCTIDFAGCE
jgi:hypothetical protein